VTPATSLALAVLAATGAVLVAAVAATRNRRVKNSPGRPLVPDVKRQIARLQSGEPEPKKPARGKKTEEN
jgi:hypothetical protein